MPFFTINAIFHNLNVIADKIPETFKPIPLAIGFGLAIASVLVTFGNLWGHSQGNLDDLEAAELALGASVAMIGMGLAIFFGLMKIGSKGMAVLDIINIVITLFASLLWTDVGIPSNFITELIANAGWAFIGAAAEYGLLEFGTSTVVTPSAKAALAIWAMLLLCFGINMFRYVFTY